MKAVFLTVALAACTTPPGPPGELVVTNVYQDGVRRQLAVAGGHVFWATQTTAYPGKTVVFCGDLAQLPVSTDSSLAIVDTWVATAGERVLVSSARDVGLLACDGTFTHLATAPRGVQVVAYDASTQTAAWGMASDQGVPATIGWVHGATPQSVSVPGLVVEDLAFHGPSLFASTGDGLLRFDVSTAAMTQVGTVAAAQPLFPRLDGGAVTFSAGPLIADEQGLVWSVQSTDDLTGNDRSILLDFSTGTMPTSALVVNLWGTTRAWSHAGALYWIERTSDPDQHYPSPYYHSAIWTAPRTGGAASYFHSTWEPTDFQLDAFTADYVYGFYGGADPSHADIRRIPLADFVAAAPPPKDCSAAPCD